MNLFSFPLLTQQNQVESKTYYVSALLEMLTESGLWWQWAGLVALILLVIAYITWMGIQDCRELSRGVCFSLILLRIFTFTMLFIYFLDIQKKTMRDITYDSKLLLLVDTSQSMGLANQFGKGQTRKKRMLQHVLKR